MANRIEEGSVPDEAERRTLRELARGVIRAQGNTFIKELLRSKKIRIGDTKEDFERNLFDAIETGQLRLTDVEAWLDEVEGWGNQHVYLYVMPEELAVTEALSSSQAMQRKVQVATLEEFWDAPTTQGFPSALELTAIRFDGQTLRLTWHEGDTTWARGKDEKRLDRPLDIGLDHYELRAYRQMARRSVMRFELRMPERLAAIFLSTAFEEGVHAAAIGIVVGTLGKLLDDVQTLLNRQVLVGDVIKNLDQAVAGKKAASSVVRPHSTRMTGKAAYIELGSSTELGSYLDDPTIGAVRLAIRGGELKSLAGTSATFEILQQGLPQLSQDVRVSLYGPQKRVRIWKLLKAEEVWAILKTLARYQ
jgi:hypothetical protein